MDLENASTRSHYLENSLWFVTRWISSVEIIFCSTGQEIPGICVDPKTICLRYKPNPHILPLKLMWNLLYFPALIIQTAIFFSRPTTVIL